MPNMPMNDSSKKKKKKKKQQSNETFTPFEAMEKKIKQRSKDKKVSLDESTLDPKTKKLLEALSMELGLSKEVIADLAITLYRFYKDKA